MQFDRGSCRPSRRSPRVRPPATSCCWPAPWLLVGPTRLGPRLSEIHRRSGPTPQCRPRESGRPAPPEWPRRGADLRPRRPARSRIAGPILHAAGIPEGRGWPCARSRRIARIQRRLEGLVVVGAEYASVQRRSVKDESAHFGEEVPGASIAEGPIGLKATQVGRAHAPGDPRPASNCAMRSGRQSSC